MGKVKTRLFVSKPCIADIFGRWNWKGWSEMKMINKASGEAVYFNPIRKNGKDVWIIQGIGDTVIIGRDRQKLKSRTFTQFPQAERYFRQHGFESETYR